MPRGGLRLRAGRPARRIKAEDLRNIDIRRFAKAGLLQPGAWNWSWWDADTGVRAFTVLVRTEPDRLGLEYTDGNHHHVELVDLARTPCHLGSDRPWFVCPGCGRRVAILYLLQYFRCRACHYLSYTSQSGELDAARARLQSLRDMLGPGLTRPKRMRQATYERLLLNLACAERRMSALFARWARIHAIEG